MPVCTMAELNESGDTKVVWDSENPAEVEAARATFDRLTKTSRFAAFKVDKKGEAAGPMRAFEPDAEKVILVPPLQGG